MFGTRALTRFSLAVSLLATLPAAAACGGSTKSAQPLPKAGDMPEGGDWTGVYFSPTYGHLHLVKEGSSVSGKWRTTNGDKWGQMNGEVTGNLFLFEWTETKIGMVGPMASTTGLGYFQYLHPPGDNVNDEIHGQAGLGSERTGVPWTAVKQRNMTPDPGSVMPDETQKLEGGGWDDQKKSGGEQGGKDEGGDKKDEGWN